MYRIRWKEHWEVIRHHKLFVAMVLIGGPIAGELVGGDRGLLFGWVVSVVAVVWLWGEGRS